MFLNVFAMIAEGDAARYEKFNSRAPARAYYTTLLACIHIYISKFVSCIVASEFSILKTYERLPQRNFHIQAVAAHAK